MGQQRHGRSILTGQRNDSRRIQTGDRGHISWFRERTLAALKRMLPRDRGRIIQVGSALAYRGIPLQAAYCASKHAIQGFMDSLRCELIHDKSQVRVTMVQMPAMNDAHNSIGSKADFLKKLNRCRRFSNQTWRPRPSCTHRVTIGARDLRRHSIGRGDHRKKLFPGLLDHYLAQSGYNGQQTDEPQDPNQRYNLYEPVLGDRGVHGRFDDRARKFSPQLWTDLHRDGLLAVGLLGIIAIAAAQLARVIQAKIQYHRLLDYKFLCCHVRTPKSQMPALLRPVFGVALASLARADFSVPLRHGRGVR